MSRIRKLQKRKTNPRLVNLIDLLLEKSAKNNTAIWKDVAERLAKSKAEVSLNKIEKYLKSEEVAVVPGKVLDGEISKPLKVAAFAFSETARKRLESFGGKAMKIEELLELNPKGTNVRILV